MKVESDEVRAKARKDVDQLMGKGSKKKSRSESGADAVRAKASGGPAEADKKALPGIRGKVIEKISLIEVE